MIFILTGPVRSGKTTLMKKVVEEMKDQDFMIDGYLSIAFEKNMEIAGYDLFDLREEKSIPFIRREGEEDWERVGPYFLIPQALSLAKSIILRGRKADILVVDEVGPLELAGKGIWPALMQVVSMPKKNFFFVVRKQILSDFLELVKGTKVRSYDIEIRGVFSRMIEDIKSYV